MSESDFTPVEQIARWRFIQATVRNYAGVVDPAPPPVYPAPPPVDTRASASFFRAIADVLAADPAALDRHGYAGKTWRVILTDAAERARGGRITARRLHADHPEALPRLIRLCRELARSDREARIALGIRGRPVDPLTIKAQVAAAREVGKQRARSKTDTQAIRRAAFELKCDESAVRAALRIWWPYLHDEHLHFEPD